jgi:hypothetical protein
MPLRMTFPKRVGPTLLTTSNVTLYTAPERVRMKSLVLSNSSGSAATVTVEIVSEPIISGLSIPANDIAMVGLDVTLERGEAVKARASVGGAMRVTFTVSDQEND